MTEWEWIEIGRLIWDAFPGFYSDENTAHRQALFATLDRMAGID